MWRPTWAEVDLGALKRNVRRLRSLAKVPLMFVVKADGYGHGAVRVARAALTQDGLWGLGVSSVEEGAVLREAGVKARILILGSLYPFESTLAALHYGLTPTVASLDGARRIHLAARGLRGGDRRRLPLSCHLKIDTGMGRVGVRWPAGREVVEYLLGAEGVRLEGIFTHLARAEDSAAFTRLQLGRFARAVREAEALGARFKWRHAANSAGTLLWPQSRWDLARPGLAAYGLWEGFEPVLSLKTRVVFLKNVPRGTPLGYGGLFRTRRLSRIATLPIGYGDGVPRAVSTGLRRASVLVRGRRCPLAGALSMDMAMVDVTGVPGVSVGDEAVLVGRSGAEEQTAADLARTAGTIPYEIVAGLTARVPRLYKE
ncbi:MAG: alanine racemase [Elusimicrobia bacterium]|nr:alanine racemase [Elusimicrobiota bacterium]